MVTKKQARWGSLLIILAMIAIPYLLFKFEVWRHYISQIPADLKVFSIDYMAYESWGFGGPGDNETGLILYEMPLETANAMRLAGKAFLLDPENIALRKGRQLSFVEWRETPVKTHGRQPLLPGRQFTIAGYLNRYGFGIEIDPAVEETIDRIASSPDSYYSFGRVGLVIVAPAERKVIFTYAG